MLVGSFPQHCHRFMLKINWAFLFSASLKETKILLNEPMKNHTSFVRAYMVNFNHSSTQLVRYPSQTSP